MMRSCENPICRSTYQDERYGKGKRVMNPRKAGGVRCTVCGKDYLTATAAASNTKKKA